MAKMKGMNIKLRFWRMMLNRTRIRSQEAAVVILNSEMILEDSMYFTLVV